MRRWILPLTVFCVAALLAALPFPAVYRWIYEGDALLLNSFRVVETQHVKTQEVNEYLKDYLGKPFYGIDLNRMAKTLELHPWISSARLQRAPPHQIIVEPLERIPVAVTSDERAMLVDESGRPFQIQTHAVNDLPVVDLENQNLSQLKIAADLIRSYSASEKEPGEISEIKFDVLGCANVVFKNGLKADFGQDNFKEKWVKLHSVLRGIPKNETRLAYIYLGNYPNSQQVAVKFELNNDAKGYLNGSSETR